MTTTMLEEDMKLKYQECQREVEQLRLNLSRFLLESSHLQLRIIDALTEADGRESVFALIAFDSFMTQVGAIANYSRKFNIHLELKNLARGKRQTTRPNLPGNMEYDQWDIWTDQGTFSVGSERQHPAIEEHAAMKSEDLCATVELDRIRTKSPRRVRFETKDPSTESCALVRDLSRFIEGYQFNAIISYIDDYERLGFYISCHNNDMLELGQIHIASNLQRIKGSPSPDEVFGICFNQQSVYRVVMQPQKGPDRALLIDFGNTISLADNHELCRLPLKYQKWPAQAIKCFLEGVNDDDGENRGGHYYASILLRNELEMNSFKVVRRIDDVLYLRLYDRQKLPEINGNHPNSDDEPTPVANPFLGSSSNDSDLGEDEDRSEAAIPLSALIFEQKTAMKRSMEAYELSKSKESSATGASSATFFVITVTHVAGVNSFYGHIVRNDSAQREPLFWHDNELLPEQKVVGELHVDDLVLAQYEKDAFWYRAKVLDFNEEKSLFKVFFVDYGNTETVPLPSVAKCSSTQAEGPYRAVLCRLAHTGDITGDDEIRFHQAVESLLVLILDRNIAVEIVNRTEKELIIRIIDPEFADVPDMLVRMGYVKEI